MEYILFIKKEISFLRCYELVWNIEIIWNKLKWLIIIYIDFFLIC